MPRKKSHPRVCPCQKKGKGLYDFIFKSKYSYNNTSQKSIQQFGDSPITSMQIIRTPVKKFLLSIVNIISLGQLQLLMQKYGFDKLFHLALIVTLQNGKKLVVEKNEQINISDRISIAKDTETMQVSISTPLTLNQLLKNSLNAVGKERFFIYDAFNRGNGGNCQDFILYLLKASHLLTPQYHDFVFQDLTELFKKLPSYVGDVARVATDTASDANTLIGTGVGAPWALHSVIVKRTVPLDRATEMAQHFINNKRRKRVVTDTHTYRFHNIPNTKFIKDSLRTKVINGELSLVFGKLG
jgi:hypothetical protein